MGRGRENWTENWRACLGNKRELPKGNSKANWQESSMENWTAKSENPWGYRKDISKENSRAI